MKKISKEFTSHNILEVILEQSEKSTLTSHGGVIKITFNDLTSTCMLVDRVMRDGFSIEFHGYSERETFIESLEFILENLKKND